MMKIQFTKGQIEKLLETYGINDIDNILKEDVGSSIIARLLGRKLVTKLEAAYGDDAVRILDNLFAAAESRSGNIITGIDKKLYVVSASGKKWSMETIKKVIDGVASGKLPADSLDLLPKTLKDGQEFRKIFQNQFKYGKPKTVTPRPTTPKPTTPNTGIAGASLTDDVIIGTVKDKFKELNIPYKLTKTQEKFFISELRGLVNHAYAEIRASLPESFTKTAERLQALPTTKQIEIMTQAQKAIKESMVGIPAPVKRLKELNKYIDAQLESLKIVPGDKIGSKIANGLIFNFSLTAIDVITNEVLYGKKWDEKNVFGFSWKQQAIWKILSSLVLQYANIGKKINIITTLVQMGASLITKDKSEEVGEFPISINDAKQYVESASNPLQREKDESGKYIEVVTKYEPVNKNLKPIKGDKGAFMKIYVNNAYFGVLQKDITGKIKIK